MQNSYQPYKGVRDFYPADWRLQNYIFQKWQMVVSQYGYERYDASVVEPLSLYQLKNQTNSEILDQQIYSFFDRKQRSLVLRPEMTPTVARMIAARRQDLIYPLRWYSMPNLWRYERPQKGRLREHWQLNVDIFDIPGTEAELELILIAKDILASFGATADMYQIQINSRQLMQFIFSQWLSLNDSQTKELMLLFDRSDKLTSKEFREAYSQLITSEGTETKQTLTKLRSLLEIDNLNQLPEAIKTEPAYQNLLKLLTDLEKLGINNVVWKPQLVRGFDYYTGIIFEFFDQNSSNRRALLGGGRYANLLASLKSEPLTGVGFGMGDVTMLDFLTTHNLLPQFTPLINLYIALMEDADYVELAPLLELLRQNQIVSVVDSRAVKVAKKIQLAHKREIPYILFVGKQDLVEQSFNLKQLSSQTQLRLSPKELVSKILASITGAK